MILGMRTHCQQCGIELDVVAFFLCEPLCAQCQEQVERDVEEALELRAEHGRG